MKRHFLALTFSLLTSSISVANTFDSAVDSGESNKSINEMGLLGILNQPDIQFRISKLLREGNLLVSRSSLRSIPEKQEISSASQPNEDRQSEIALAGSK